MANANEDGEQTTRQPRRPRNRTPKGIDKLANLIISHYELRQHGIKITAKR